MFFKNQFKIVFKIPRAARLKHGWFHLKLIQCFEISVGAQLEPALGGSATRFNSLNSASAETFYI